jgi:coatomer subunit beta
MVVDTVLILCALLKSPHRQQAQVVSKKSKRADMDSMARMQFCLKILTQPQQVSSLSQVQQILVDQGRAIFAKFLESHSKLLPSNAIQEMKRRQHEQMMVTQPDEAVNFRQLKKASQGLGGAFDITEELSGAEIDTSALMGEKSDETEDKIYQLTGYSDPIYAEAFVTVHHYDILLKIVLINRTMKTIQNVNVELLTQGNLKVVEKP